jgi:exodeoxyribonuclease-3
VLIAEFPTVTVINAYFPNTQREHTRLGYKLQFCDVMLKACEKLRKEGRTVLLCGDFNVAHKEIDLRFPKANENNAGFLPEEREWMSKFLSHGYVDGFRKFEPGGGHYTWWSYRPGVRDRNIGWRIDYHVINAESADRLRSVEHRTEVRGSDHCPVVAVLTE